MAACRYSSSCSRSIRLRPKCSGRGIFQSGSSPARSRSVRSASRWMLCRERRKFRTSFPRRFSIPRRGPPRCWGSSVAFSFLALDLPISRIDGGRRRSAGKATVRSFTTSRSHSREGIAKPVDRHRAVGRGGRRELYINASGASGLRREARSHTRRTFDRYADRSGGGHMGSRGALLLGIVTVFVFAWRPVLAKFADGSKAAVAGALLASLNTASEYGFVE